MSHVASRVVAPYLEGLNPRQLEAVEALDGPLLVLAGAGTGKTRVLTARIAHLIMTGTARPNRILAVTFTNKAAREMRERVARIAPGVHDGWWIGTFHSVCARLLREYAELAGLDSRFTILDVDDQIRLMKPLLEAENVDAKRWPARQMLGVIDQWKNRGQWPDDVRPDDDALHFANNRALALYRQYQDRLTTLNAVDFGDLLLRVIAVMRECEDVLEGLQQRFQHILVDEYQDTNAAQYLWLRLLAQRPEGVPRNLCCVGDDDQSIYGWRGADVGNILRFEKDFPGAQVVRLEQNYRSTGVILAAASGVIAHNEGRLGKTLWTEAEEGERLAVKSAWDGEEEARIVGDEIEIARSNGTAYDEMAILVRAGFQMREFEDRLSVLGVPHRIVGGPRFYERQEIRDALAYLRLISQPADDLALERVVNRPKRGLGEASLKVIRDYARAAALPMLAAAEQLKDTAELRPQARRAVAALIEDVARWRHAAQTLSPSALAEQVLDESGYTAMWRADSAPDAAGRLENLKELVAALIEFDTLQGFLEHVALVMEAQEGGDRDEPRVTIMTLHAAKGLEFDLVFLPGWEEGLFPHQRALDESGTRGLEEERRLAYVGLTRARRRAILSHAGNRRIYNQWQPAIRSRFLGELPETACAIEAPALGGAGAGGYAHFDQPSSLFDIGRAPRMARRPSPPARPPVIDAEARPMPPGTTAPAHAIGARVFHRKFGYGVVRTAEGDKLEIDFEHAGEKKVMASFVVAAEAAE